MTQTPPSTQTVVTNGAWTQIASFSEPVRGVVIRSLSEATNGNPTLGYPQVWIEGLHGPKSGAAPAEEDTGYSIGLGQTQEFFGLNPQGFGTIRSVWARAVTADAAFVSHGVMMS